MSRPTDFGWTIDINGEEVDVTVTYAVTYKGYAGCGPSWNHPGDPPESPEFEILSITRDDTGESVPVEFGTESDSLQEALVQHIWEDQSEPDYPEWGD